MFKLTTIKVTSFGISFLLGILLILNGCRMSSTASGSTASSSLEVDQASNPQANQPTAASDPLSTGFRGGMPGGAEAWRQFTADGRYRMAHADDFNIPESVMLEDREGLQQRLSHPYIEGDINNDNFFRDRAVIVIDTTRNDAGRFGLVIFNESENGNVVPQPHWLYRARDLSRTILSHASSDFMLIEYHVDGTYTLCRIKWNRQRQEYSCS
jgi:hypothetical protein